MGNAKSVAKLTCSGCRIQVVHKTVLAHSIGAHIFGGNQAGCLINCLIIKKIFGTDAANVIVRIYSPRLLT
jgi:hypothetical protein